MSAGNGTIDLPMKTGIHYFANEASGKFTPWSDEFMDRRKWRTAEVPEYDLSVAQNAVGLFVASQDTTSTGCLDSLRESLGDQVTFYQEYDTMDISNYTEDAFYSDLVNWLKPAEASTALFTQ